MRKTEINSLIDRWLTAGAINHEQADYMKYDLNVVTSERSGNFFINAIMYIGAIGLSLGFLLLIASNWSDLPNILKFVLSIMLPVLPLCYAYWDMVVKESGKVLGRASNILGVVLIGGALSLIGQMYHLEADIPMLLWQWALLSAPFVYVFKQRENVLITATLTGVAIFASLVEFLDDFNVGETAATLLVTLVAAAYAAALYLTGVALRYIEEWIESGRMLRIGSASLGIVILFITTFKWYSEALTGYGYRSTPSEEMTVIILSLIFNLIFIGFLVFALVRAAKFEEFGFAMNIVRVFGLYLIVKYFTLFFDMFDTGLFFVLGGALFIAGGWVLERNKSRLVAYMKGEFYNPKKEVSFMPKNYEQE